MFNGFFYTVCEIWRIPRADFERWHYKSEMEFLLDRSIILEEIR